MTFVQLAALAGAKALPANEGELTRVASPANAGSDTVVFAQNGAALERALRSDAGAIFAPLPEQVETADDPRVLRVPDPKYAFALAAQALLAEALVREKPDAQNERPVHPSAVVHASASFGVGTRIGAGAVIEQNAIIGEHCCIGSRVTVCTGIVIGNRVVVQPGAVLGSLGFGYVRHPETGEHLLFPQQGTLVIEDDVEIGANTTIDRGALGETRIGRGTKIDNLVQIGHNCVLGRNVIVAAQVGMSGSCLICDGAVLAGQVGLGDHVTIGPGVILGGSAGVFPGKHLEGPGQVFMGVPAEPLKDYLKNIARVRRLK